ncbi:MAG TPA: porin, partial [Candidatus Binatia bacterium]|nr:porin [Candidatus Binatia bacterium]
MNQLKLWLVVVLIGSQFMLSVMAADDAPTNAMNDGNAASNKTSIATGEAAAPASADAAEIKALKQQVETLLERVKTLEERQQPAEPTTALQNLDQKVRVLERQRELDQEAAAKAAKQQPLIKLGADGFTCVSDNTNFSISLHGLLQLDSRTFFQNAIPGDGGFFLRRVRPILSGTVYHDFNYVFMPDFGGASGSSSPVIQDAYVNYRYRPELQMQAGKFKSPVGLEFLQSARDYTFNELTLVKNLGPGRDLGVELHGDLFDGTVSYAVGIFNGVADSANASNGDFDNHPDFAGRVFFQPWKTAQVTVWQGLGFGVAGSYGDQDGTSALGKYTTDGLQSFFAYTNGVAGDGEHWRISPQGYYYYGPFGLLAEYIESSQKVASGANTATLDNRAWEVTGSWILTGEKNSYKGVAPEEAFNPARGHWGA